MIDNKKTGRFIAELRKSKGLTQNALAELLDISNKAVSKWETGEGLPDVSLLPPLAQALGVTVDELLAGERAEAKSIKVEEVANEKNRKNIFSVCWIISFFSCVSGALLGNFNNIYCFVHFQSILFYTHWEIIFDAAAFFAVVFGCLLFSVSAVRLNVIMDRDEIIARTYKKAIALSVISLSFVVIFFMRVVDRYVRLGGAVAIGALAVGAVIIAAAFIAAAKLKKKYGAPKADSCES